MDLESYGTALLLECKIPYREGDRRSTIPNAVRMAAETGRQDAQKIFRLPLRQIRNYGRVVPNHVLDEGCGHPAVTNVLRAAYGYGLSQTAFTDFRADCLRREAILISSRVQCLLTQAFLWLPTDVRLRISAAPVFPGARSSTWDGMCIGSITSALVAESFLVKGFQAFCTKPEVDSWWGIDLICGPIHGRYLACQVKAQGWGHEIYLIKRRDLPPESADQTRALLENMVKLSEIEGYPVEPILIKVGLGDSKQGDGSDLVGKLVGLIVRKLETVILG